MFVFNPLAKTAVLSIVFLLLLTFQLSAQNNNRNDEPISEEHYEILKTRQALIGQDISSDKNEWSGVYRLGDHHPTVFMWSLNQGFLTWGSNHTFHPSRINFGKAEFSNNRLILKPEINKEHLNFQFVPTELVPVKWGEQHFLIPADELINFAYAVHSGAESQIVWYFAKSEDYQKSRAGLPDLPKELQKIMTMKAVRPMITAIKKDADDFWKTEISLNLGRADKLIKGMYFYYSKPSGGLRIRITDLQEKSSKAVMSATWTSGESNQTIKPKVGMKFTSKAGKDFDFEF
jgi:hypothetical protein